MVNVIQRGQRFDNFLVRFILFEFFAAHRYRHGIHAQSRIDVRLIALYIVDAHTEFSYGRDEVLQVFDVFKFEMYLEVIGTVFKVLLDGRKQRQAAHKGDEHDCGYGVQSRADGKTQ